MTSGNAGDDAKNKRSRQFPPAAVSVQHFHGSIDALRELLDVASPHAKTLDTARLAPSALTAVARLSPEKRAKLAEYFEWNAARIEELNKPEASTADDPEMPPPEEGAKEPGNDPADPDASKLDPEAQTRLNEVFEGDQAAAVEFAMLLYRSVLTPDRVSLLNESILTMAVASLEALLAALATEHFVLFPGTLDSNEREFSLADLAQFETIEDARDAAIDARVLALMRGSLEDWAEWFTNRYKLDFRPFVDFAHLTEIFQRRHILVHNGGRVSRLYLKNVSSPPMHAQLGRQLRTDTEYVLDAIDTIQVLGVLTGATLWCRWQKDQTQFAQNRMFDVVYSLMLKSRWNAVRDICRSALNHLTMDGSGQEVTRVNYWLAEKRLGNLDEVRAEIAAWDTSALAGRFQIAKAALLDDLDQIFGIILSAVERSEISQGAIAEWPLLDEFRQDDRYPAVLAAISAAP